MAAYFETAPPVKHRLSGAERRTLLRKREGATRRFRASKKIVASLAAKRSNSKSEGAATLCGERKPFRVFVSPFVSPGCIKMGTLLMTWDDEASSASY